MMIKLFTDSDLDGLGCGLLAKIAFPDEVNVAYCSYRNLNERVEKFIDHPENEGARVYITDLAVNKKIEGKLAKRFNDGKHIQMIDHHVTAMHFNEYKWGFVQPEYESGRKTSATSLFYEHLVGNKMLEKTKTLDEFVELVRQYDTWEWETNDNRAAKRLNDLFFILGLETFENEMLERVNDKDGFHLSDKEELILDLEEKKIDRYIHSKNRQLVQTFIDDYCVGVIYAEQYLSELGNALAKLNPHLDLIAMINMGTKKIGFRTIYDEVDVSSFAKKFEGGGHPKASGCSLFDETFSLFVKETFPLTPLIIDAPKNEINKKENAEGSLYINRKGEKTYLFQTNMKHWVVLHNHEKVNEQFDTFESAERYVKRNYASGLAFDNELVTYLGQGLKKPVEEIRKNIKAEQENFRKLFID